MAGGYVALYRRIFDHPTFAKERFTEREAWVWLIMEAAWAQHERRIGDVRVALRRGQVAASVRVLADEWGWSVGKVRRYTNRLQTDTMVSTATDTGITIITICNYEKYQNAAASTDTAAGTAIDTRSDTATDTIRRKQEDQSPKKKDAAPTGARLVHDAEADLFNRGKEVLGLSSGGLISRLLKAKDGKIALARAAIEQASTKADPREYIGAVIRGRATESFAGNAGATATFQGWDPGL